MKNINIDITKENNIITLHLSGNVNMDNYVKAENILDNILTEDISQIIIDMEKIEAVFSSGLGMFIRVYKKAKEKGIKMKFTNIPPKIKDAFETVGLTKIFNI